MSGNIEDLLQLKDLGFTGTLTAPASLVLREFRNDTAQAFGGVTGQFEISDASGELALTKLEMSSEDTDLWTMQASAVVSSVTDVDGLDFSLDLGVPNGKAFLAALQLEPVDIGRVAVFAATDGTDDGLETRLSLSVGESRVDTVLKTVVDRKGRATVRGEIQSTRLRMSDLDKAAEAAVQLASLDGESQPGSGEGAGGTPVLQSLVLEETDAEPEAQDPVTDSAGRTIQPLVLEVDPSGGKPTDILDLARIGRELDLEIAITVNEIVGQAGVSAISSELVSKGGKADFGPLEFNYGGGYFKVGAAMDFVKTPQLVRIYGATGGWDFGEILDEIGLGIKAHGRLRGQFDVTGSRKSARGFINSMYGSATVSMANGNISSSLLELAGLGIFPWLFSRELRQGYTDIVCAVAPLRINAGKVSSNAIVVETKSVQLLAAGSIDWRKDRIAIRAEPRPVGRPLARSAWPFEVTGKLSKPGFRVVRKPRQPRPTGKAQTQANRQPCKPDIRQLQ